MVDPSLPSTLAFVALVLALAALFVAGVAYASRAAGDATADVRRRTLRAAAGIAAFLVVTAAASELLRAANITPLLPLFFVGSLGVALATALSPLGARLASGVPIAALVAVQGFRLPLELILNRWYRDGVLPVQMTFEGHNFDVVSGVLALAIGAWLYVRRAAPPRAAVWTFNLIGSALLLTVSTIAVLSSPLPIRQYLNDPPVLLAYYAPYGWIVPFCVGGALFVHVLVFRWLLATREPQHRPVRERAAAAVM